MMNELNLEELMNVNAGVALGWPNGWDRHIENKMKRSLVGQMAWTETWSIWIKGDVALCDHNVVSPIVS